MKAVPNLDVDLSGNVTLNDKDKQLSEELEVFFVGDYDIPSVTTFTEAVGIFKV